ncbi:MAG: type II toxin-antitoxin system VapC family toxin [bacterium]|nr:type II toxin-antitoxin system VapC family toxin [bacterium]
MLYDEDFQKESKEFFDEVKRNRFTLVTSAVVQAEIEPSPKKVKEFFEEIIAITEVSEVSEEAIQLRDAYLIAGILTPKYSDDALHVALATVSNCSLIVSWNFKHIVHFEKIPLYNAVNTLNGYPEIKIFSPMEVIKYEDN